MFSYRLPSFDYCLFFLCKSMNIPFIETWLLTDPIQCFSLYMCKKFKKVTKLKIWILCSFDSDLSHLKSFNLFLCLSSRGDRIRSKVVVGNFYLLVFLLNFYDNIQQSNSGTLNIILDQMLSLAHLAQELISYSLSFTLIT